MARASTKTKTPIPAISDVEQQVAAIKKMSVKELQAFWLQLNGETTSSRNRLYLQKRLRFRVQELAEGGLSERAKAKASEIQGKAPGPRKVKEPRPLEESAPAPRAPKRARDARLPAAGTVIEREYKNKVYEVTVHDTDFEYEGKRFTSLSTIAREITGQIWNGYLFFQLTVRGGKKGAV